MKTELLNTESLLPVTCPSCKTVVRQSIAQIATDSGVRCSACGQRLGVDKQELRAAVQRAEYLLHDIGRGLARQFKY